MALHSPTTPARPARRAALAGGLVMVLVAILALAWNGRSDHLATSKPERGAPKAQVSAEKSSSLTFALPAERPSKETTFPGRWPAEPTDRAKPPKRFIRGRVVPWNGDLPVSPLHVVAGGLTLKPGEAQTSRLLRELRSEGERLPEATRATVARGGTFDLSISEDLDVIQLHVIGDHALGDGMAFFVDGEGDMGDSEFEVEFSTAALVTFGLIPPPETTQAEREQFTDCRIWMLESGVRSPRWIPAEIHDSSVAGPIFIPGATYDFEVNEREDESRSIAPFMVEPSFKFAVEAGKSTTIEVPLARGRRLEGMVRDTAGAPIPNAEVRVEDDIRTHTLTGGDWYTAKTDQDGRFVIPVASARSERIHVQAGGFETLDVTPAKARTLLNEVVPVELTLRRSRRIHVRVIDPRGQPAANFPLVASALGKETVRIGRGRTDEQGHLTLRNLPNVDIILTGSGCPAESQRIAKLGTVRFAMAALDSQPTTGESEGWFARAILQATETEEAEHHELTLALLPRLVVDVVPGASLAAEAHWVTLQPVASGIEMWPETREVRGRRITVGDAGRPLEIPAMPGRYALQVCCGKEDKETPLGARPQVIRSKVTIVDMNNQDREIRMVMGAGLEIIGTAHAANGESLGHIPIKLRTTGSYRKVICEVHPDPEGRFRFSNLRPGRYEITAGDPFVFSDRPVHVTLEAGQSAPDLDLEVARGGYVRIHVMGPDGEPTTLGQPKYLGKGGRFHWAPVPEGLGPSLLAGPFAPGPLTLQHNGTIIRRTESLITSGETHDVFIQLPSTPLATVTGTLRCPSGDVEGVELALYDHGIRIAETYAGLGGHFELPSPVTGRVELRVGQEYQELPYAARELQIEPGANSAGTIELPGGKIDGTLVGLVGSWRRRDLNLAARRVEQPQGPLWVDASADAEGFMIPFLKDGTYEVAAWDEQAKRVLSIVPVIVEIKDGQFVDGLVLEAAAR